MATALGASLLIGLTSGFLVRVLMSSDISPALVKKAETHADFYPNIILPIKCSSRLIMFLARGVA